MFKEKKPLFIGNNALDINSSNLYYSIYDTYKKQIELKLVPENANINITSIQSQFINIVNQDYILIQGVQIKFSDDYWDFSNLYVVGKQKCQYEFNFNANRGSVGLTDYYKLVLKLYLWYMINNKGIHYGGLRCKFNYTKAMFTEFSKKKIRSLEHLRVSDFKNIIDSKQFSYKSKYLYKTNLKSLLIAYSYLAHNLYTKEFHAYLNDTDMSKIKAIIEANKTPLLPTPFFKKFTQLLESYAKNTNNTLRERGIAGLLYIGTQTGLRSSELVILETNCIEETTYNENIAHKLIYYSVKNSFNGKLSLEETVANDKVKEMVDYLNILFQPHRKDSKYLVPVFFNGNLIRKVKVVYEYQDLQTFIKKICILNCRNLNVLNANESNMFASAFSVGTTKNKVLNKIAYSVDLNKGDVISCPRVKQFRVYFATELNERGYSERVVFSLLAHESTGMLGYYNRPTKTQHEILKGKEVLTEEIIKEYTKTHWVDDAENESRLNVFLNTNKLNVGFNVNSVIDKVYGEFPVVVEPGGLCIKPNPLRICRHDISLDKFKYVFGIADHSSMYFMVNVPYKTYEQLKATYNYNKDQNFVNQAQKELYKLEFIINEELIPCIQELEKELLLKGKSDLIDRHPDLAAIIDNLDEIKGDVESWKLKISELN